MIGAEADLPAGAEFERLRNADDVRALTDVPLLAEIPNRKRGVQHGLAVRDEPTGANGEAFRTLRTNLGFMDPRDRRSLVFSAVAEDRNGAQVPANLAWSLAQAGWSVLLVSAPRPNGRSWHAIGYTIKGSMDTLRVVLLCRPADALPGLSVRTRDIASGAPVRAGRVSCPAGMRATTGGLEWIKDGKLDFRGLLTSSRTTLDGKGWYVAATADDPEITARMRVLCLPR